MKDIKTIAIIGTGIAGLTAAHLLHKQYDVSLFEANDYIGGHTHTVDVHSDDGDYAVDTGFIVFNEKTYPNFIKLLDQLGVNKQKSNMSFSFSAQHAALEYSGDTLNTLFAQRKNIFRPKFYRLLFDIFRFNRQALAFLEDGDEGLLLKELLNHHHYSGWFKECYLNPLTSAIWSTPPNPVNSMPARFIIDFYRNHGLLSVINRPQWYVIANGSREYVKKITKPFADNIYLNTPVVNIKRHEHSVDITTQQGQAQFDAVVMACHSDQALALLSTPTQQEYDVLNAIPYCENKVTLHTDETVLPQRRRAWASWNYCYDNHNQACLSYYMNKLQSLDSTNHFCVSLNTNTIKQDRIIDNFTYAHPVFNQESVKAKQQHHTINNRNRTFYVGAYWHNGFHEDGVVSSLNALAPLGVAL